MTTPVLRRIVVGPLDTNCWVLHADGDRRALLVDPGDEPGRVLDGVAVLAHPADAPVWPHELATLGLDGHWDAGTATADLLARDPALLAPAPDGRLWDGSPDR